MRILILFVAVLITSCTKKETSPTMKTERTPLETVTLHGCEQGWVLYDFEIEL